jgi:hypothetical protein
VEYSKYLESMKINDAGCTRKIKSRIVMKKNGILHEDGPFHQQIGLKI